MPNKKRKRRIKEQRKRKKSTDFEENSSDSDSGDSTFSYVSTTSTDGDDMEDRVFEKVLDDYIPRLKHKKKEARICAYKDLYKLLTQKIRPSHFPSLKIMIDDLRESCIRGIKKWCRDDEEVLVVIPVFSVILLIGYDCCSEEVEPENLIRLLEQQFKDCDDDDAKALIVRALGLIYFLYGESAKEDAETVFNKYVNKWHKKSPTVWNEGVNVMSLLISQIDPIERVSDILPHYEGYFLGNMKRSSKYNVYNACGSFFALIYDGCYRKKMKSKVLELLRTFSKTRTRRLKMDEKKKIRQIISWIENDEEAREVKLNGKAFLFDSWLKEVRYGFVKKVISGGLNYYLRVGSPCVSMLIDILHLNKTQKRVEKKKKFLESERMNFLNGQM